MYDEKDGNPCLSRWIPGEWYKQQIWVGHQATMKHVEEEQDMWPGHIKDPINWYNKLEHSSSLCGKHLINNRFTSSTDCADRNRFIKCSWSVLPYSTIPSVFDGVLGCFRTEIAVKFKIRSGKELIIQDQDLRLNRMTLFKSNLNQF